MERRAYLEQVTRGLWGRRAARLIRAELYSHLESCTEELIAAGWSSEDAEDEAQRRLGDPRLLAYAWRRTYYAPWLNAETGLGLALGLFTGSEPWWMGVTGPWQSAIMTGGILLLALIAFGMIVRQLARRAWVGAQFSAWSLVSAFWLAAVGTSVLIGAGHPLPPAGLTDWYGPGYIRHLIAAGSLLTGMSGLLFFSGQWALIRQRAGR